MRVKVKAQGLGVWGFGVRVFRTVPKFSIVGFQGSFIGEF